MLNVSHILCDQRSGHERLRYSHRETAGAPRPVVVWALTRGCNLRCVHCYASADNRASPSELSGEEARAVLDDLAAFEVPAVLFSGGEPLSRPDAPELIARAVALGLPCTLSTNGTLIDEPMADRLAGLGLRYVGISVDGTRRRHDRLRGMDGAYEKTMAAIDHCLARRMKVGLRFTVHALNRQDLPAMFEHCIARGIQRLCIYHLAYAGRGGNMQNVDLGPGATREVMEEICELTEATHQAGHPLEVLTVGNHADAAFVTERIARRDPAAARKARTRLNGSAGNRSGCHIASIDFEGGVHYDQFSWHYTCGNVREAPFSAIWSEPSDPRLRILRDRAGALPDRCQGCRHLAMCNGNLRTRAETATGNWLGEDPACYLTEEEISMPTLCLRVTDPPLELEFDPELFQPNPTTVRFARGMRIEPGDTVFDIGTGIGPLAITAALAGAERVVAVDPVPGHVRLARRNIARHEVGDRVEVYEGRFFEPFEDEPALEALKADVIVGDVSGIAEVAARALGWYPPDVPTGGPDGTEMIRKLLAVAPEYLKPGGRLYFPVAVDLSDHARIDREARRHFEHVENALSKPYVDFPLSEDELAALHEAYGEHPPAFINVQAGRRPRWRGQVLVARGPRPSAP